MGTNYYLTKNSATVRPPLHIGKSSAGWKFIFRKYEDLEREGYEEEYFNSIENVNDWKSYLEYKTTNDNYLIMTEYDEQVSLDDFWSMVEKKQKEKSDYWAEISYIGEYDFCDFEFS